MQVQISARRPSRALLTSILAQLPANSRGESSQLFWWLRLAIPAGVALLIGIVFFNMQGDPTQVGQAPSETLQIQTLQQAPAPQPEGVLSFASLGAEEEEIEQVFAQQEKILADEQAQLEVQGKTVLEQVEMSEENVVKIASRRAAVIEVKLEELAREGKNVEELELLLADAQSRIEEATTLLHTIREDLRAEDANEATIHATRDTFRAARKNTRDVYETFRTITREAKNL